MALRGGEQVEFLNLPWLEKTELAEDPAFEGNLAIGIVWLLVICVMFVAQHRVCDSYFVPAINVFVEAMRKSDNKWLQRWGEEAVAGATICALGCNGPELFANLVSLYTCNDAGIGVVVGSEIFNLLVIVGAATCAAPIVPLALERVPFTRDCFFYGVSIICCYLFLKDDKIDPIECAILLIGTCTFVTGVYFTTDIVNLFPSLKPAEKAELTGTNRAKVHGIDCEVHEVLHGRMADSATHDVHMEMKVGQRGIMTDREDVSAAVPQPNKRGSIGVNLMAGSLMGPILHYNALKEVAVIGENYLRLEFEKGLEHVSLVLKADTGSHRDELLESIKKFDELTWVHKYDATPCGAAKHLYHTLTSSKIGFGWKLFAFIEFAIDLLLTSTLCFVDVKDIRKEKRWPLCFVGAMCWLAVFSFLMLEIATIVNYYMPYLPMSFLGVTVCAVGTSFPNMVASVIMASQNKPGAAIANALGSNVQNVFLAMALPWAIYLLVPGHSCKKGQPQPTVGTPIPIAAEGLDEGIVWMALTLFVTIIFVLLPGFCTLSKPMGVTLMLLYLVYLVLTSLEAFKMMPRIIPDAA